MADSEGRMIRKNISKSQKIASLNPRALSLFCLLIPHFNSHGKMDGEPAFIKGAVCPLVKWLTIPVIKQCLQEISAKTNVKWFKHSDGLHYLHATNFSDHQDLRFGRLGKDYLPSANGVVPEQSGSSPAEVEVKEKGKKGKGIPPLLGEVREYMTELEIPEESDHFFDHYSANGWKQSNGRPIVDWKAACRNWKRSPYRKPKGAEPKMHPLATHDRT